MRIIKADATLNQGEIKISSYLTVAQIRRVPGTDDIFTIVLDDRKKGTKTDVPNDARNLHEAFQQGGMVLLARAKEDGLDDMDNVLSSALVTGWTRRGGPTDTEITARPSGLEHYDIPTVDVLGQEADEVEAARDKE